MKKLLISLLLIIPLLTTAQCGDKRPQDLLVTCITWGRVHIWVEHGYTGHYCGERRGQTYFLDRNKKFFPKGCIVTIKK